MRIATKSQFIGAGYLPAMCVVLALLASCGGSADSDRTPPAASLGVSETADNGLSNLPPAQAIDDDGYVDNFDRQEIGPDWLSEDRPFRIEAGQLVTRATSNRGLWLRRTLPRDVRIEFKVRAEGTAADIKLEVFGDGKSATPTSGYIVIFGGWGNTLNVIARRDERLDRAIGPPRLVEKGRTYRMRIERRGNVIEAYADDALVARYEDKSPLEGAGHQFFAFNGWQSELWYDDLRITPL